MSKIIDNLYLGSYQDIKTKFYNEINAKLIVNVTKECKYETLINQIKLEYADNPNVNILENIEDILNIIHKHILNKESVFVHCYMGKSRSVTIILAYLIKHQNFSLNCALKHVRSIRDICPNIGFLKQLISYEMKLKQISTINYDDESILYIASLLELDINFVKNKYNENNCDIDKTIDAIFN